VVVVVDCVVFGDLTMMAFEEGNVWAVEVDHSAFPKLMPEGQPFHLPKQSYHRNLVLVRHKMTRRHKDLVFWLVDVSTYGLGCVHMGFCHHLVPCSGFGASEDTYALRYEQRTGSIYI
jgi:hypothetical protein